MPIYGKLIVRSGSNVGDEKELNKKLICIGRDPSNDLILENNEISRLHTKITQSDDSYLIEDLNSTNGTFINGRKITKPENLFDGDLISLGESNIFEISISKEEENSAEIKTEIIEKKIADKDAFLKENKNVELKKPEIIKKGEKESHPFLSNFSKLSTWKIVLLMALGFIILFCVIPLVFIELTNQWCNLFSGFFNAFSSGVCP